MDNLKESQIDTSMPSFINLEKENEKLINQLNRSKTNVELILNTPSIRNNNIINNNIM